MFAEASEYDCWQLQFRIVIERTERNLASPRHSVESPAEFGRRYTSS